MVNTNKTEEGYPVIVINLGDSRAFVGRYNSTDFKVLTKDHKPDVKEETERIVNAGAQVCRSRINASLGVSRAFGDSQYKDNKELPPEQQRVIALPDVSLVHLQTDEFLFICCDGIFESFSNEQTIEYLRNRLKENPDQAAILSDMLTAILKGGSKDNMSAMLIQLADGTDYNNQKDDFLIGTYYPAGNDSYQMGFKEDCEKHGLKWEDVEKTVVKTSLGKDPDFNLAARSMPTIAIDKTILALKTNNNRPGITKSSRNLMVSPSILVNIDKEDPPKPKEELLNRPPPIREHVDHPHPHPPQKEKIEKISLPPTPSQISDSHEPITIILDHHSSAGSKEKEKSIVLRNLLPLTKSNSKRDPKKEKNGKPKTTIRSAKNKS
jgi:hypothetical protein